MNKIIDLLKSNNINFKIKNNLIYVNDNIILNYITFDKVIDKFTNYNLYKNSGCRVITIYEDEFCESHLKSMLGIIAQKIFARKCKVREISKTDGNSFFNKYHIQKSNKLGIIFYALFYENEIVGVISLGKHPRQSEDIVLDRLCFKENVQVIGGASKLFKQCLDWAKENGYHKIISFSDNRYSKGDIYEILNFKLEKEYGPDYSYIKNNKRLNKQKCKKKNINCPEGKTESEYMQELGHNRLWDCGKKRWIFNIKSTLNSFSFRKCGYYETKKAGILYYQSSYELRAMVLLDEMEDVKTYCNQIIFNINNNKRILDFLVTYKDDSKVIIEIKPFKKLEDCVDQIKDNKEYALQNNWKFKIWTEEELGFKTESNILNWANAFVSTLQPIDYVIEHKKRNKEKQKKHYINNIFNKKITVYCEYCKETHNILKFTYDKNIKKNKTYICERYGGHLSGLKNHKKENKYAEENKKQCTKCKLVLEYDKFSPDKSKNDGFHSNCKICRAEFYKNKYQKKNK